MPVNPEVAKAQTEALADWARQHETDGRPRTQEIAFLLRRAANQIGLAYGFDVPAPEPIEEPEPLEMKAG